MYVFTAVNRLRRWYILDGHIKLEGKHEAKFINIKT